MKTNKKATKPGKQAASKATETALAMLPAPSGRAKPSKADVIEALVDRARVKWKNDQDEGRLRKAELIDLLRMQAEKEISARRFSGVSYASGTNDGVRFYVTVSSSRLAELSAELAAHPSYWRDFPAAETRKKIRAGLNATGAERLLNDPETVKALDGLLAKLADKEVSASQKTT